MSVDRSDTFRVYTMCAGFFVLFFGYFSSQNFVTTQLGSAGSSSLGVLYGTLCFFSPLAPVMLEKLRKFSFCCRGTTSSSGSNDMRAERNALCIGSALYAPFLATCSQTNIHWAQLVCSALLGSGAALLWIAQGSLLSSCGRETNRGHLAGLFWASFQAGNAAGNFGAYFIVNAVGSLSNFFLVMACVAATSTVVLAFIRPRLQTEMDSALIPNEKQDKSMTVCEAYSQLGRLFVLPHTLLLVPLLLLLGAENSFWSGSFSELLHHKGVESGKMGLILGTLASTDILFNVLLGRLSDRIGQKLSLCIGMGFFAAALFLTWRFIFLSEGMPHNWAAFTAACCFGAADAALNTILTARLSGLSEDQGLVDSRIAFVLFQFVNTAGSCAAFLYAPAVSLETSAVQFWILGGLTVVGTVCFLFAPFRREPESITVN